MPGTFRRVLTVLGLCQVLGITSTYAGAISDKLFVDDVLVASLPEGGTDTSAVLSFSTPHTTNLVDRDVLLLEPGSTDLSDVVRLTFTPGCSVGDPGCTTPTPDTVFLELFSDIDGTPLVVLDLICTPADTSCAFPEPVGPLDISRALFPNFVTPPLQVAVESDIPEPGTLGLLGFALLGLCAARLLPK